MAGYSFSISHDLVYKKGSLFDAIFSFSSLYSSFLTTYDVNLCVFNTCMYYNAKKQTQGKRLLSMTV